MDPLGFVMGYLYENALQSARFRRDVVESFVICNQDIEAIVARLEVLEHNQELHMVSMIRTQGEA